jgi:hypothetical protein
MVERCPGKRYFESKGANTAGVLLVLFALPLWACTTAGAVVFLVSVALHQIYQQRQWSRLERSLPIHFPSQPEMREIGRPPISLVLHAY